MGDFRVVANPERTRVEAAGSIDKASRQTGGRKDHSCRRRVKRRHIGTQADGTAAAMPGKGGAGVVTMLPSLESKAVVYGHYGRAVLRPAAGSPPGPAAVISQRDRSAGDRPLLSVCRL